MRGKKMTDAPNNTKSSKYDIPNLENFDIQRECEILLSSSKEVSKNFDLLFFRPQTV